MTKVIIDPMRLAALTLLLACLFTACQVSPTISPPATGQVDPTLPASSPSATFTPAFTRTPPPTSTPVSNIPVKAVDLRGVQVEFWHPWTGDPSQAIDSVVRDFNQSNIWGITAQATSQGSSSGLEDALSGLQNGAAQALVVAASPEAIAYDQAKHNTIVDLSPYLSDPLWGLNQQETADFWPAFWGVGSINGQRLSIPLLRNLSVLFYNQTWAQALGFQNPPVSTTDFQAQACAAAKANLGTGVVDNAGTGGWLISTSDTATLSWLSAFEAMPASDQPAPFSFNNSSSAQAFGFLRTLADKNCAWSGRNPTPSLYFAQRKAIFYSGTLEDLPFQQKAMAQQKNSDDWAVLAYPNGGRAAGYLSTGTSLAMVNASPEEQLAAWLFLRWLIQPPNQAEMATAGSMMPASKSALDLTSAYKVQISSGRRPQPGWARLSRSFQGPGGIPPGPCSKMPPGRFSSLSPPLPASRMY